MAEDGSFQLTTNRKRDGAAAGDYVVTISWCDEKKVDGETVYSPDKMFDRYSKVDISTLTATVKAGKNDLPRFDLK